jgi:hypothetical protein
VISNPVIIRTLRDLLPDLERKSKTVLFLSPIVAIPLELEKDVVVVKYPLPTRKDLGIMLDEIIDDTEGSSENRIDQTERVAVIEGAQALTYAEARNAFSLALATEGSLNRAAVRTVLREKAQVLRKGNLGEWIEATSMPDSVGGFGNVKKYLATIAPIFWNAEQALQFGLLEEDFPRSIAFVGMPGCGKSEMAKAIAAFLKIGMVKTNFGRGFGSKVGESESNIVRRNEIMESMAPVVDWWDEAEKQLAGVSGSKENPWEARVGAEILTWFEEFRARILVVATINRQEALPPEMLSRFQKVFFVDLPNAIERVEIFRIHCQKRNLQIGERDFSIFSSLSDGFNGREIRNAIQIASQAAFSSGSKAVGADHVELAIQEITPLSRTRGSELDRIRQWAKENNVEPASEIIVEKDTRKRRVNLKD